jgi:predicted deacylase
VPQTLVVGSCSAAAGSKATGVIDAGTRADGGKIEIPVLVANGAKDGPKVWLNGSIHGDEPEGPLALLEVFQELDPARMSGAVVAVPVINGMAFESSTRGNPLDTFAYDMNRIYPGRPDGFLSERIAHAHSQAMTAIADVEVSIHSGGAHSYLAQAAIFPQGEPSLALAKALGPGWDLLLRSFSSKGSPGAVMSGLGRAAITLELGGLCDTMPARYRHNARVLADTILNILRHYHVIPGTAQYADRWSIGSAEVIGVEESGLWVPEHEPPLRKPISKGTLLARVVSLVDGSTLQEVRAPKDCVVFGLRTRPQIQAGDWAVFYSVIEQ